MNFIKKYWKHILITLFVILFFSTCISNCTNKNKLRTITNEYMKADSIINRDKEIADSLISVIKDMDNTINGLNESINEKQMRIDELNNALNRNIIVNIKTENHEKQ